MSDISFITFIERAESCTVYCTTILHLILIFISFVISLMFIVKMNVLKLNMALIFLACLLMVFDLVRFIMTTLFLAAYWYNLLNLLARNKKILIFIYSIMFLIRNSLNLCILPLSALEAIKPFWDFGIFYFMVQLFEFFLILYLLFSKIRVSRVNSKKKIIYLTIGSSMLCFFSLLSFMTKIIITDDTHKNTEFDVTIGLILLIDILKAIFWALNLFFIIFGIKITNSIVIGSLPIIFIFLSFGRLITGGLYLKETEPLNSFYDSVSFEIFYIITNPIFDYIVIFYYKVQCPDLIYELEGWTHSQIKKFVGLMTLILFFLLISVGTLLNFLSKSSEGTKSAYGILNSLVFFDFVVIINICLITKLHYQLNGSAVDSHERLRSKTLKNFSYFYFACIGFWGLRILLGIVSLSFVQDDIDYLSEVSDSQRKSEVYEALVSLKSFYDYEFVFIFFSIFTIVLLIFTNKNNKIESNRA